MKTLKKTNMKNFYLFVIVLIALLFVFSIPCNAQQKPNKGLTLTVTFVFREGNKSEVYARSNYRLYVANCTNLPDTVRIGTKLNAFSFKGQEDCICLFKRVR